MSEETTTPVAETKEEEEWRLRTLDAAVEKMRGAEKNNLNINIDQAWKEKQAEQEPIRLTFRGVEYEVSPSMTADFGVFYMKNCLEEIIVGGKKELLFQIPEMMYFEFLEALVGEKLAEEIKKTKLDFDTINTAIIRPILAKWGFPFGTEGATTTEKKSSTPA